MVLRVLQLLQEVQMRLEAKVRRHDSPYAAFLLPDHIDEASQPPATDMRTATTAHVGLASEEYVQHAS
eukprot:m.293120 g.293120  ORF g.293120 m.293120 type:complete len:68 (-) comp20015_c0_seq4:246-449(-)